MTHGHVNPTLTIIQNASLSREINFENTSFEANALRKRKPEIRQSVEVLVNKRNSTFFEFNKFVRFVIVGGATFVFQFCIYWICSRVLMPNIARLPVYMLSLGYAIVGNYTAHRFWTFHDQKLAPGSVWRYICVTFSAILLNAVIFYLGVNILRINDMIIVIITEIFVSITTYTGHRFFTFK